MERGRRRERTRPRPGEGRGAGARERPDPHDGRPQLGGVVGGRSATTASSTSATATTGTGIATAKPRVIDLRGRTVVPGLIESARPHRQPGQPSRLSHDYSRTRRSIREVQEALAARRKDVPPGQWITSMGGWHPNQWTEHRHADAAGTRRRRCPTGRCCCIRAFTGPCATNSMGKAFFDMMDAAPPVHPDIKPVKVRRRGCIAAARIRAAADHRRGRCFTCGACRRSTTSSAARSMR